MVHSRGMPTLQRAVVTWALPERDTLTTRLPLMCTARERVLSLVVLAGVATDGCALKEPYAVSSTGSTIKSEQRLGRAIDGRHRRKVAAATAGESCGVTSTG